VEKDNGKKELEFEINEKKKIWIKSLCIL